MVQRMATELFLGAFLLSLLVSHPLAAQGQDRSQRFLYPKSDGQLVYAPDALGNRVPDYSRCGFQSGNAPLPDVQAVVLIESMEGDATATLQKAIDYVSDLPLNMDGIRGAVLLGPGDFYVDGQLSIRRSGVALRGSRIGTTIHATGRDRRTLIRICGAGKPQLGHEVSIADNYVAVGTAQLKVADAVPWHVGSEVVVTHPSTQEWIASIGMNQFPTDDKGSWLDWKARSMDVHWERTIQEIDGKNITFDAPLTCSIDAKLTTGAIRSIEWPDRIERIGVESLRLVSVSNSSNPKDEDHSWDAIGIEKACDVWVRDVTTTGFAGSSVSILETAKRVSVVRCTSSSPISEHAAGRRRTFYTCGQQTLFQECQADSGRNDFAVGYLAAGPNAFVDCRASNAQSFSGPIESWATGVLYDNITMDGGGLSLTNREIDGQGIGWTTANSLLWQCSAPIITCRNPPGHQNWAIGCWGGFIGDGYWKSMNEFVKPESLYRTQHAQRMEPSLSLIILNANPVSTKFNEVALADQQRSKKAMAAMRPPISSVNSQSLSIRNGWLCVGDKIVTGNRMGTMWWRGSMLPSRISEFGVGVTRFVPGRTGAGFTDDLDELTDSMVEYHQAILEHHWGLWYDRRRDDHEMIRRINGEVWAPFYEQPWARSGQGLAWDGLSKYDLEAFNPWYFSRLCEFASQCESKGRILLHQMYFQHNVLEAGAHWADFPWRSANCLQPVGFPEPPAYANNKRIFQADEFYDVEHPVRRALHSAYIQHCLTNMLEHKNVVFSIGEEFTGPASFVRFWLETIAEWKKDHPEASALICLGCTQDVQDEILADERLNPLVQIIDLKYWWYTADGSLYAPPGGANLAPRQQLREWKGNKSRSDMQTARQIHEVRLRFPDKAILCPIPTKNSWATIAAGGSIPNRNPLIAENIFATLPQLSPMESLQGSRFGLALFGEKYLVYGEGDDSLTLSLASFGKEFSGQWLDPISGAVVREIRVAKGIDFEETPPSSGAHLLWLESQ